MSFFDALNEFLDTRIIKKPIFTKDFSTDNSQLIDLTELASKLKPSPKKEMVERDMAYVKQGLEGEKNVYFELKNSFLPILCLHDIRLEYEGYVAQFDFIVISNKFLCILETKKLNGDIEITSDGDFIRTIKGYDGRFIKKEGMYSPISQNERHLNILKEILGKEKLVVTLPVKSLVVMANPKTILNKSKCSNAIQKSIYKYDQVIKFLKDLQNDKTNVKNILEKSMYAISDYLIKNNKPLQIDYSAKFGLTDDDFIVVEKVRVDSIKETVAGYSANNEVLKPTNVVEVHSLNDKGLQNSSQNLKVMNSDLIAALKKYRLEVSRQEAIKPYMVFSDKVLEGLLDASPKSSKELLAVKGFAEKKVAKYGDEILKIFRG